VSNTISTTANKELQKLVRCFAERLHASHRKMLGGISTWLREGKNKVSQRLRS